jgi:hypothetical protein
METKFISQPDTRLGDMIDGVIAARGTPLEFVGVSAFASLPTVLRLKSKIAEIKAAGCDARLVLGVDLGGTSKEVLQEVATWCVSVIVVKNRMFGITFHPKIYLLRWQSHAESIVGSNNLTDGGLYRNYEASSRTLYALPADQVAFDKAQTELKRFLKPAGPVAAALTPAYLEKLLALPEIPSEATARRIRAEGIPKRPPSNVFGYESVPSAPRPPRSVLPQGTANAVPAPAKASQKADDPSKTDAFDIQVRAHHNGEIFLSVTAALQNPSFFNWPFNGQTTPKKPGNPSYPQITPDPVVDIVVYGPTPVPLLTLSGYLCWLPDPPGLDAYSQKDQALKLQPTQLLRNHASMAESY